MNKPTLYIPVGLSGSGKSTIATKIANENANTVIISTDSIRKELTGNAENQEQNDEVFNIFHNRIYENLVNKKNVIADATNLTIKSRRAIMNRIGRLDIKKVCYVLSKPYEQCKIDNKSREKAVPDFVIHHQVRRFQVPFKGEGLDEIHILNSKKYTKYNCTIEDMIKAMTNYDQKNPHHTMTLDKHSSFVSDLFINKMQENDSKFNKNTNPFAIGSKIHDFGKLYTQTFDDEGIAHYIAHEAYGSYYALSQLTKPDGWSDKEILDMCFLISYHMMPFNWNTDKANQRWRKRFGEYKYQMLLYFNDCDRAR